MKLSKKTGFTIIELIVSIAIISLILTVVLFNSRDLSGNLALSGVSQEISLLIRQAQAYGVSVKESSAGLSQFNYGYGVFFDTSYPDRVIVYNDTNSDGLYSGGVNCNAGSECVEIMTLKNNITISQLCSNSGGTIRCSAIRQLYINFIRPNPEPIIKAINPGGVEVYGGSFDGRIVLTNPYNKIKTIIVDTIGKISVQ